MSGRKLKARLHIGRMSGDHSNDEMRIEVADELSGVHFLELRLSPHDMMCAITARSVECDMEVRGLHLVGSKSEYKVKQVKFKGYRSDLADERKGLDDHEHSPTTRKILAPFEKDGWRGSVSDLFNGHRRSACEGFQKVGFHRFVDAKTGKPILNP